MVSKIPKLIFVNILLLLICIAGNIKAQSINYAVHANIIYHFTKYIDWPTDKKVGPFVIGIIGDSPIYEILKKTAVNKTAGRQNIVVKELSSTESFAGCNILFLAEEESHRIKKIVAATENEAILIVSEYRGLSLKGSCINFIIEDSQLIMEINTKNITKRKLKIASELLSLGRAVE